jgi:5-methylcytosine-specific restriction endonuclease McrA
MDYRIAKDCGTGWDETYAQKDQATVSWGVSANQRSLAGKVAPEDIFLHYIDHAQVWAGYSIVSDALCDSDESGNWLEALPFMIRIKPVMWLNKDQCYNIRDVPGLSGKHYHRQSSFTKISADEASLIIETIESASASQSKPSVKFEESWTADAESYYKRIVKGMACGECCICGEGAESWIRRIKEITATKEEVAHMHDAFLDAAHILPANQKGKMAPDNLRALCPNCHRIVDKLSQERRKALLLKIPLQHT